MEETPELRCSCAHCEHFIDYSIDEVGQIIECPNCKQRSLLPPAAKGPVKPPPSRMEPPPPKTNPPPRRMDRLPPKASSSLRRLERTPRKANPPPRWLVPVGIGLVVVGLLVLLPTLRHRLPAAARATATNAQTSPASLPAPKVKRPKSLNDLKIGNFTLQPQRGSEVRIVSGDIENDSETLHRGIKVELDVRDARGLKVDSLDAFITELAPHAVWHVLAKTSDSRAASVSVTALQEPP